MKDENMTNKKYIHTVDDVTAEIEIVETEKNPTLVRLETLSIQQTKLKILKDKRAEYFAVRKAVAEKLEKASQYLPEGYQFKIYETYRSFEKQKNFWNEALENIQKANPNMTLEETEEIANKGIANPYKIGSGHQTGGAVDITLVYQGYEVDMGTAYLDTQHPNTKTNSTDITAEQKANRLLLKSVLEKVGLVNYPLEWWHFSYGEQEWAVLTKHKSTLFGVLKKPFQNERE